METQSIGIIGNGSWATALAKMLTDNGHRIGWWIRGKEDLEYFQIRHHNPHYLTSVFFDINRITLSTEVAQVVHDCDILVICIPSAFVGDVLKRLGPNDLHNKTILSAIKGILPGENILLNQFLDRYFHFPIKDYYTITGPCHAEEVAAEKLSYLTFSGLDRFRAENLASLFKTDYIQSIVGMDVWGVQYASVLKNIYALGAGIAHGLEYGDNFLSVLITNSFNELKIFLEALETSEKLPISHHYNSSTYLGDLLVTCYSPYSRNRAFGNMIGKGYGVRSAQLELNMIAEGHFASKCLVEINKSIGVEIRIAQTIYEILWEHLPPGEGIRALEKYLL
ncbi:MAG: NAD(P)H-dependent glycerol-3-phosphate dehydrogenase [Chitinophagaceae bacterium]